MNPSTENMTRPANKEVKLLITENIIESLKVKQMNANQNAMLNFGLEIESIPHFCLC